MTGIFLNTPIDAGQTNQSNHMPQYRKAVPSAVAKVMRKFADLLEKESPEARKAALTAWKAKHGVWTHHAKRMIAEERPWMALKLPDDDKREPVDAVVEHCRLLEESGRLVFGPTEWTACEILAESMDIELPKL